MHEIHPLVLSNATFQCLNWVGVLLDCIYHNVSVGLLAGIDTAIDELPSSAADVEYDYPMVSWKHQECPLQSHLILVVLSIVLFEHTVCLRLEIVVVRLKWFLKNIGISYAL